MADKNRPDGTRSMTFTSVKATVKKATIDNDTFRAVLVSDIWFERFQRGGE